MALVEASVCKFTSYGFTQVFQDAYVDMVVHVMRRAHWAHAIQVATKRSERLRDYLAASVPDSGSMPHIWWVSVLKTNDTVCLVLNIFLFCNSAAVRFLSIHSLKDLVNKIDLTGISWL